MTIATWNRGTADEHMDESLLTELGHVVRRHPWWRARADLTLALLARLGVRPPSSVVDVGCGWGVTLEALERVGYRAVGVDVSRRALERLDRPGRTLVEADITQAPPDGAGGHDAVLALDVVEHLDDDRGALANLGRLASPGGVVVVSVPALPELYGEFDEVLGHRRRYLPETIRAAFAGTGLALEQVLWWGAWAVPLLRRQRKRRRGEDGASPVAVYAKYLELPPWPVPSVLRLAYAAEQRRALEGRLKTGTSLIAVARAAASPTQVTPRA
jgi:2-polyprenyl-3-methyl-5-hydroxy-6-metoxy-1,4-benzoquinol methylase